MKRNILICMESLRVGGAERLVAEQLHHWDAQYWSVSLMTFSAEVEIPVDLGRLKQRIVLGNCSNLQAVLAAYRLCREMEIDLVICHLERPIKWLGFGARLVGARVITVVHSVGLYEAKSFWKKILLRCFYRWIPTRIVAVSEGVARYLQDFGLPMHRIDVIPNGVDVQQLRARWSSASEHGLVLCVLARLEPVKGLDLLIEALSRLTDFPWSLKIVGEGSSRPALERQAAELGMSGRVSFLGCQREPFRLLNDVAAVCMPSRREGLPMALLECQALGIPAIVSDVGYLPDLIAEGFNGFVCHSDSVDSLADALIRFFSADETARRNLATNARVVADRYDIKECVARYMALAEFVCGKN